MPDRSETKPRYPENLIGWPTKEILSAAQIFQKPIV
jgi:hypothetical protein